MTMFPRSRSTRYVAAAVSAIFVVSTLYYVQVPHSGEYLPHWTDSVPTQDQAASSSDYLWDTRAAQVKQAFRHAYGGYKRYANGYDELRPLSNTAVNNFNGWNVSMYDSLDTMILMGLWDEFADALPVVQYGDFRAIRNTPGEGPWTRSQYAPFFETAIRYLGGLLAAYALSGESILLDRASDLATLLEPAFNTPEGLPRFGVNTNTTATTPALSGIFAEVASCQLEWTYAAHATGNKTHYDKASKVISTLADAMEDRQGGMFPTHWHLSTGRPTSESRSVGAAADSGHEYLLKQYLLTGKTDIENLEMYLLSMNEVLTRLLYITPERGLLYVTETSGKAFTASHTFEHLACFFPGLLALGAHTLDLTLSDIDRNRLNPEARRQYDILIKYDLKSLHMAAAEGLATSCWLMYADQPSGLGPEVVSMAHDTHVGGKVADRQGKLWIEAVEEWRKGGKHGPLPGLGEKKPIMYTRPEKSTIAGGPWDYVVRRTEYFLRPETIESIYIMWRTTGNPVWRERGWAIFEAIERETKTASGYASLKKVTQSPGLQMDDQPSYFLAETLKYLYLLFKNEDLVPLDKWVFNTEAHPLPIFTWSDWQKHKFGIPR